MPTAGYRPSVFISYAHEDEPENPGPDQTKWLSLVQRFLRPACVQGLFEVWTDRGLRGGDLWDSKIESGLRRCDIFLLLVSPNSTASDYIVNKEVEIVCDRQVRGDDVLLFPLLLTPTPQAGFDRIRQFNIRPGDGKPLSSYQFSDRDNHMVEIADEIAEIAKKIASRKTGTVVLNGDLKSTTARAFSNVPIGLPLHFLGRDDDLAAIETALNDDKGHPRNVALHGIRGVGKSTLAAAYAERHKPDYRVIWWLRAQTPETVRADLVGLAMRLGWVMANETEELALETARNVLQENGEGI